MGSTQSSFIKREATKLPPTSASDVESNDSDMWERINANDTSFLNNSDEEGEEDEDDLAERLRILEDSRKLKMMAEYFLHPENPVKSNPTSLGRCYFERASAPEQMFQEESQEASRIENELAALKKLALAYRHPELLVESCDVAACARCYFERASAPEQLLHEEEEEKARILSELQALKKAACDYLHPEAQVATTDSTIFGRNYFSRFSATETLTTEEEIEQALVLKEANELNKLARNAPVAVDPTLMGRNYFSRPSAPQQKTAAEEEEREIILQEAMALHRLATYYYHPELPLQTNTIVLGRNYFDRLSAPEEADEEERQLILDDAMALRKLATDYLHPELPVLVTDPTTFGRNYFTRPSAPAPDSFTEEREQILADTLRLEQLAVDFHHPELPVQKEEQIRLSRDFFVPKLGISSFTRDAHNPHALFDMQDDIHLHHAEFHRGTEHYNEITEVRMTSPTTPPTTPRAVIEKFDLKVSMSPGCVMTFAQSSELQLPEME